MKHRQKVTTKHLESGVKLVNIDGTTLVQVYEIVAKAQVACLLLRQAGLYRL